jgi:hypothetical protein
MIMNPRPLVAAIISTATMLLQAPAMARRIPVRMNGTAARIWTCSSAYERDAPSVLAHRRRSSGIRAKSIFSIKIIEINAGSPRRCHMKVKGGARPRGLGQQPDRRSER